MPDQPAFALHKDADLFRAALTFTSAQTGFLPRLLEKDYFCSAVLQSISTQAGDQLVFKGGTCLTKAYLGFYRLSEDLDFGVSIAPGTPRSRRRAVAERMRAALCAAVERMSGVEIARPLTGANASTQYNAELRYRSSTGGAEPIKVEISLREPLLLPSVERSLGTALLDPLFGGPALPEPKVACIALEEALAEKVRAALTRRDVAIRDFFDLWYACEHAGHDFGSTGFLDRLRQKLRVPGTPQPLLDAARATVLHDQRETILRPVLRASDYERFDLDRTLDLLRKLVDAVASGGEGSR
jgi:predicted nucleotidyltransferase component of viral defense system